MSSTETLERSIEDEHKQAEEIYVREAGGSERGGDIIEPGPGDFIIRPLSQFGHIALGPRHHIRRTYR